MARVCSTVARLSRVSLQVFAIALLLTSIAWTAAPSSFTNSVAVNSFSVAYPDGWTSVQGGGSTTLINAAPDKLPTLSSTTLNMTPQIQIYVEQRTDHNDALTRLKDIEQEYPDPVTSLTIGGYPAIQRRHVGVREQPGGNNAPLQPTTILTITTAIAAGSQLIRLEGRMPADIAPAVADQVAAIETAISFLSSASLWRGASFAQLEHRMIEWSRFSIAEARVEIAQLADKGWQRWKSVAWADDDDESDEPTPPISDPGPGGTNPVLIGGVASEPEVAVSADGRNIVVGQQFVWTASNDGGQTFPFFGNFPGSTGGDSSLA